MKRTFILLALFLMGMQKVSGGGFGIDWLTIGNGFLKPFDSRPAFQIECKGPLWLTCIRTQAGLLTEEFHSAYIYGGAGFECEPFPNLFFFPSFCPGFYCRGKGVNLGCFVEFRSSLELALQLNCRFRIGGQFFHLSNARLGRKNPGVNGVIFFLSFK